MKKDIGAVLGLYPTPLVVVGADFADTAEMLGLAVFALVVVILSRVVLARKN